MAKYRSVTVYREHPVSHGNLGEYINKLLDAGIQVVQVVNGPKPHAEEQDVVQVPVEPVYVNVQGNVGSS